MMRSWVRWLAASPRVFDLLRWILEGGYARHRQLIHANIGSLEQKVLDCGCGTGIYASCFSPANYTGVDISAAYIQRCRQRCPQHHFHVMDAMQLEFSDGVFGSAMISGVLHHMNDDEARRICREVRRVLKPGGTLLIWEDIPTRSRWNWIGATIHRLDLGEHIRLPDEYQAILAEHFTIQSRQLLRSGVMDYVALICMKPVVEELVDANQPTDPGKSGAVAIVNADVDVGANRK